MAHPWILLLQLYRLTTFSSLPTSMAANILTYTDDSECPDKVCGNDDLVRAVEYRTESDHSCVLCGEGRIDIFDVAVDVLVGR